MVCLALTKHINMYVSCWLSVGKLNSRHTLRFWRISIRAAAGREAVSPVVLFGQQRRPFPVCHHSKHRQEEALQRRRVLGPPVEISGRFVGEISTLEPVSLGFLTSTWHGENAEGGSETTKTSHHMTVIWVTPVMDSALDQWAVSVGDVGGFKDTLVIGLFDKSVRAAFKY